MHRLSRPGLPTTTPKRHHSREVCWRVPKLRLARGVGVWCRIFIRDNFNNHIPLNNPLPSLSLTLREANQPA